MLRTWWRQALVVLTVLLVAACSGGGCSSGCSSCGVTPLAAGFPQKDAITNAASVRVTKPGLDFVSANIPTLASKLLNTPNAGVITFNIPSSSTSIAGTTVTICPNGPQVPTNGDAPTCVAEIEIGKANLAIDAVTPNAVVVSGTLPVRIRDLPLSLGMDIAVGDNMQCKTDGTTDADFHAFPLSIQLPLVHETLAPRDGYTMVDTKNAQINFTLTSSNLSPCSHCGVFQFICNPFLDVILSFVTSTFQSAIVGQVHSMLDSSLCTKSNPALNPVCPVGSHPDYGDAGAPADAGTLPDGGPAPLPTVSCVFDSDPTQCVPTLLGLDGHVSLGQLLASISPGTSGALDFVLASGGDMDPAPDQDAGANGHTPNGITLGMVGGTLPQPQSDCVNPVKMDLPTAIPIPDEMKGDTLSNWPDDAGPHVGVAIDGRFLNYAMGGVYNSGLLCLGVSTENFQQLNTGILSVLIQSVKDLAFERQGAPVAITTHPSKPPVITLGGGTDVNADPLMSIALPQFGIDFYVWSEDRYVRAFTFTSDLTIPVNLETGKDPKTNPNGGLLPTLGKLGIANGTVTNSELLTDDPALVATSLQSVMQGIVGQLLGGGFKPIDLSSALSSLGLTMNIPQGGIRKLTKDNDQYLAIFAELATPKGPKAMDVETTASLVSKTVHPESMTLTTMRASDAPSIRVRFDSPEDDGSGKVEYAWRLDRGTWSAWSSERDVTIADPMLFFQAKHSLQVAARAVGNPASEDRTPAEVDFAIDVLPPTVKIVNDDGTPTIDAWDVVSPSDALVARTRATDARGRTGWSEWAPVAQTKLDTNAYSVDVEVRDEEGNIGTVSSALIRGTPDPTMPGKTGCSNGCSTGAGGKTEWPAIVAGIAALALVFARRRRAPRTAGAALALGSIVAVAGTTQGCGCGGSNGAGAPTGTGCGSDCNQPCGPALPLGLVGAYTSIAKAPDGTLWVAGYDDAVVDGNTGVDTLYGDLVVGKYDSGKQQVQWVTVDGLPPAPTDGSCPANDPKGWRGGSTDSGPDVGLWTSIAIDANGHPIVAYYDATNQALKFASSADGVAWTTHTIAANPGSDIGRYAKLLVANGKPAVAYSTVEKGTGGHTRSKVSVAHGNVATPASPSDWSIEDALVDETGPCRSANDCDANQACTTTGGGTCAPTVSGCSGCSSSQACVTSGNAPACVAIKQATDLHPYPIGVGDYIAMASAPNGLALVAYDRVHGNLLGLSNAGGAWSVIVLDGETGSRSAGTAVDTGDDGVGASLFVATSGDWHVSYVDGITESLKYLFIPNGALSNTLTPQIVDDGTGVDGAKFTDGMHIVGDDSFVRANDDGTVTITYQDATVGALRIATGSSQPGPSGPTWELHAIQQPNRFAGFFPHFVPGDTTIANWWRWSDATAGSEYGDVAIVPSL
jgi:hypothetical protein